MRRILKITELAGLQDGHGIDRTALAQADRHIFLRLGAGKFLMAFRYCDIRTAARKDSKVYICCGPQDLIYVTDNKEIRGFADAVADGSDSYRQLLEFFIAVCADDLYEQEKIEDRITKLEDGMLTKSKRLDDSPAKIIAIRRELLNAKRYYEQLRLIAGELADDEADCLSPDIRTRFAVLARRLDRLLSSVLHLREYITQVREAYQAQLDIQQNQIMKVFTVISGIFMPLTLIVGWYGMNLKLPEFEWTYGYLFVIVLCLAVCAFCLAFFRRKRWF